MKAPETVIEELLAKTRNILYKGLPDRAWFTQQVRVKFALTLPAKWLDERKVELSGERYQAIVESILDTIKANGRRDLGAFPCAYLHSCVESHLRHHGDDYYTEGKSLRNTMDRVLTHAARVRPVVAIFAQVHASLEVGKRKAKIKPAAAGLQPDLFGGAKPDQIAKLHAPSASSVPKCETPSLTPVRRPRRL
jgi:hypothetical protein